MPEARQRADARRNRELILRAAQDAFAASGPEVPLDVIAAHAGVGPGTVYRHFPTKDALFRAVAAARISALTEQARTLTHHLDAAEAFFIFLDQVATEGAAKRDLPAAVALADQNVDELHTYLGELLARAQEVHAVRADIALDDLVTLLKTLLPAVTNHTDPGSGRRLFRILSDGLRPPRQ